MALPARAVWAKVEVEFVAQSGTYVDISARVMSVTIPRPRSTDGTCATTQITVQLNNAPDNTTGVAPFTASSPLSPYWPYVTRDRRVRVTTIWAAGASTSQRFLGWSDLWVPGMSDGTFGGATCTLTASDVASRHARRTLLSDYAEQILLSAGPNDYWPLDEDTDAAIVRGLQSDSTDLLQGHVYPPYLGTGSMSLQAPDSTILVDGSATFSRGDTGSASPVIALPLRSGVALGRVSGWVSLPQDPAGLTDDVFGVYDRYGNQVWRLVASIVSGQLVWKVEDGDGNVFTSYSTGYARDDSWHWLSLFMYQPSGSGPWAIALAIRDKAYDDVVVAGGSTGWPFDPRFADYLIVGGRMIPVRPRSQTNTMSGSVSSMWVRYNTPGGSLSYLSASGIAMNAVDRAAMLIQYGGAQDTLVGGGVGGSTADSTPVMLTGQKGKSLLDAWNEHALTIGGLFSVQPDGRRRLTTNAQMHPTGVAITFDAEGDLDIGAGAWTQIQDERPTRVTATGPVGSVTYIDTVTEASTGLRLDGAGVATSGGTLGVLKSAAAREIVSARTRLSSFGINLMTSQNDLTATLMGLLQGYRARVNAVAKQNLGVQYLDVYLSGWTEVYSASSTAPVLATWVFDTDPADDPPEMYFDDPATSRFGFPDGTTVTGGTCVGGTGTGTVIITSTSPLTTSAGQYPMDLDWNGERITISGVGGGTSPQTATVTARGVAPSYARVHAAGEIVDVYHAWTFG